MIQCEERVQRFINEFGPWFIQGLKLARPDLKAVEDKYIAVIPDSESTPYDLRLCFTIRNIPEETMGITKACWFAMKAMKEKKR